MSSLETKKIEPLSGTTVTLGAAGDAVTMPAGVTLKTNTVKDAGGNTIWTSDGSGTLSSVNSALTGSIVLISSQTFQDSSGVAFTSGIDSTYDEYVFYYYNIAGLDETLMGFQVNASGQFGYNEVITSTNFYARHTEGDSTGLAYQTSEDQNQETGYQALSEEAHEDPDASVAGELHLFDPSNTTYVKHFLSRSCGMQKSIGIWEAWFQGYINTTAAITEINFKALMSGTFSGTIAMYGMK